MLKGFESDFKAFNKRTNYLGKGNVITNTQHSWFIRVKPEEREYDLSYMQKNGYRIPKWVLSSIPPQELSCLYLFKLNRREVCWILTDQNHKIIVKGRAGNHQYGKEVSVMESVIDYIGLEK